MVTVASAYLSHGSDVSTSDVKVHVYVTSCIQIILLVVNHRYEKENDKEVYQVITLVDLGVREVEEEDCI